MSDILPRAFYARDTRTVARDLLGALLVRRWHDGQRISGIIVETEAYLPNDSASHAFRGKSPRNSSMYGAPGIAYVYLIYGMHYCLNTVTESVDTPAAVLVRALQPYEGQTLMRATRTDSTQLTEVSLCKGPGRLAKSLSIDRAHDGTSVVDTESAISIEQFIAYRDDDVLVTPRIGVSGNTESRQAMLRWHVRNHRCVSGQNKRPEGNP